jgi:hypothetical protein
MGTDRPTIQPYYHQTIGRTEEVFYRGACWRLIIRKSRRWSHQFSKISFTWRFAASILELHTFIFPRLYSHYCIYQLLNYQVLIFGNVISISFQISTSVKVLYFDLEWSILKLVTPTWGRLINLCYPTSLLRFPLAAA